MPAHHAAGCKCRGWLGPEGAAGRGRGAALPVLADPGLGALGLDGDGGDGVREVTPAVEGLRGLAPESQSHISESQRWVKYPIFITLLYLPPNPTLLPWGCTPSFHFPYTPTPS